MKKLLLLAVLFASQLGSAQSDDQLSGVSVSAGFSQKEYGSYQAISRPPKVAVIDTSSLALLDSLIAEHTREHASIEFVESFDSIGNEDDPEFMFEPESSDELPFVTQTSVPKTYDLDYWKSIDTCFLNFDSLNVNPYKFNRLSIKDTIPIILHDLDRKWKMPLDEHNTITSSFGHRGSRFHYGSDLRVSIGDTVRSVFDGIIRIKKYNPGGYGNYVMVRHHNGLETLYGHLSEHKVQVGQLVKAGECIGLAGNTGRSSGPHLHFEVRYKGNAINPTHIFDFENESITDFTFLLNPQHFKYISSQRQKVYHRIRPGDTLYGLSRRYHVKASYICKLNGISTKSTLKVGRMLRIK